MAIGSLLILSCSKSKDNTQPQQTASMNVAHRDGGEDDDRPIIIINHVNIENSPVSGSSIKLQIGNDVVTGTTDNSGVCSLSVPYLGQWNLSATNDGYVPINTTMVLVDSVTSRIDTLLIQQ
jgi:hypothetical protein